MSTIHATHTQIFSIQFEESILTCQLDSHGNPAITSKKHGLGTLHTSVTTLIEEFPFLTKAQNLLLFAKLANFLFKGLDYEVIEDVEKYKQEYLDQIDSESESFELPPFALTSYGGEFDVKEISPPYLKKDKAESDKHVLVFYATQRIPYRISCEFSLGSDDFSYRCELLPYV